MDRPAVGDGELDDEGHDEQSERGKARADPEREKDRQDDLARAGETGYPYPLFGRGVSVFAPGECSNYFTAAGYDPV